MHRKIKMIGEEEIRREIITGDLHPGEILEIGSHHQEEIIGIIGEEMIDLIGTIEEIETIEGIEIIEEIEIRTDKDRMIGEENIDKEMIEVEIMIVESTEVVIGENIDKRDHKSIEIIEKKIDNIVIREIIGT